MKALKLKKLILVAILAVGSIFFSIPAYATLDFGTTSTELTFTVTVSPDHSWGIANYSSRPAWIKSITPSSVSVGFYGQTLHQVVTVVADRNAFVYGGFQSWEMSCVTQWYIFSPDYYTDLITITAPLEGYANTDINGDGISEQIEVDDVLISSSWYDRISAYRASDHSLIWQYTLNCNDNPNPVPLFADLNGDGAQEIILMSHEYVSDNWRDKLYVFDHSGYKWAYILQCNDSPSPPILIADLNGDGAQEIILMSHEYVSDNWRDKLYVFGYSGYKWAYILQCNDIPNPVPLFADLNRDGGEEIILMSHEYVSNWRDKLYVFGYSGYKWAYVFDNNLSPNIYPAFADMDGNGTLEVVAVNCEYSSSWYDYLYILDHNGSIKTRQQFSGVAVPPTKSPIIKDTDADWKPEVSVNGTQIYESSSAATNKNPWPYEQSQTGYTGRYTSYAITCFAAYDSGDAVTNATVTLGPFTAVNRGGGSYKFDDFTDGTYTVNITPPNYSTQSTSAIVSGDDISVSYNGFLTYSVSGAITYGNGDPVGDVVVGINVPGGTTHTGISNVGTGAYTITGIPKGAQKVEPSMSDYKFDPEFTNITVSGATSGINFKTYVINGYVTRSGTGINGINVTIKKGTDTVATIQTVTGPGGAGYYEKKGLGTGTYTIQPAN